MEIDEMILKASKDGKTYVNSHDGYEYSRDTGFLSQKGQTKLTVQQSCWEEKAKRHLTVYEAEKELDCVIELPGLNPIERIPTNSRKMVVIPGTVHAGYYSAIQHTWRIFNDGLWEDCSSGLWIDLPHCVTIGTEQE